MVSLTLRLLRKVTALRSYNELRTLRSKGFLDKLFISAGSCVVASSQKAPKNGKCPSLLSVAVCLLSLFVKIDSVKAMNGELLSRKPNPFNWHNGEIRLSRALEITEFLQFLLGQPGWCPMKF